MARAFSHPYHLNQSLSATLQVVTICYTAGETQMATANQSTPQCIQTVSSIIPLKHIVHVKLNPQGPHSAVCEVIDTMEKGTKSAYTPLLLKNNLRSCERSIGRSSRKRISVG
uniref:Uncharacterized protein n=1 Tax=Podarcis muralis TaxID=64176 RepID=A0A670JQ83_PODMU